MDIRRGTDEVSYFFLILRKLCNAPSGTMGVDDTEIIFHSSFGNHCLCHSLA